MVINITANFEDMEVKYLIEVIYSKYGIDFREYKQAYLIRRIHHIMGLEMIPSITSMADKALRNDDFGLQIINQILINVTDMFRTPMFYKLLIKNVIPTLSTYPNIKIWIAGCSSGEEVLSMAILLKEAGLYNRTTIVASDLDQQAIDSAKSLLYPKQDIREWTKYYFESGGKKSFSDYYNVRYDQALFNEDLLENVQFISHDLTSNVYPDGFHLILCRNVLIYFKPKLQNHVITSFTKSLKRQGFLGLGYKETIRDTITDFKEVDAKYKIYRLKDE